jgi:putative peptide zinc metalloprotease protein
MPHHSHAEGVLWLPEEAMVRAGANGFFGDFLIQPGAHVGKGVALVRCYDPALAAQLSRAEAKVAETQAEYDAQFVTDRAKAQVVRDRLVNDQAILTHVRDRASEMTVRSRIEGVFTVSQMGDMPERYFRKGDLIGYILGEARPLARVVVTQDAIDFVRLATERVRVRRVDDPHAVLSGKVTREVPAGGEYLPSGALAPEGGGEIAIDPRDTRGPKALQRIFQFDIELDGLGHVDHFGQRVLVRFEHSKEPLSIQWYRSIRLLFLSSFNV